MNKVFFSCCALIFLITLPLTGRDIDLDAIYISKFSPFLPKLAEKKMEIYEAITSRFIERNVSFAVWVNGNEIVYVQDFNEVNIVAIYNRETDERREVLRVQGTVTVSVMSPNGKYLFLKAIIIDRNGLPAGQTIMLNLVTGEKKLLDISNPFLDFSLSPGGNSVIYQVTNGIIEFFPEAGTQKLVLTRRDYSDMTGSESTTLALLSPNRQKILLVHGSGGSYGAKVISQETSMPIYGVTSLTEMCWINNQTVVYRKGGPGNYSAVVRDIKTSTEKKILGPSFNTNITYSGYPEIITLLKDQIVYVYDIRNNSLMQTGIEGEDVSFTPDGSHLISLLYKKLFISKLQTIMKKKLEINKPTQDILRLYEELLKSRYDWTNDYSKMYLERKIAVYRELVQL
jgi:hypothetical protein